MVILSCLVKKNQNLNLRKKRFSLLLKREVCRRFCLENATFSNKLNFLSSDSNFDYGIRLKMIKKKICCVGSCGYAPASVNYKVTNQCFVDIFELFRISQLLALQEKLTRQKN